MDSKGQLYHSVSINRRVEENRVNIQYMTLCSFFHPSEDEE